MKTRFVLMLLVALGLVGCAQQGPAQQQHAPPGASTAPASAAVAQAEHLTLWGITVGVPAPAWPKCTG
jgi:ABC-type glycerol-3-phosphate transport system substrate-binding protein